MSNIHPTAIVADGARLDPTVTVGPYSVIGEHVSIGAGTTVGAHCVIDGRTTIGADNRIFQFNSIGAIPQDKKYAGEPTERFYNVELLRRTLVRPATVTVDGVAVPALGAPDARARGWWRASFGPNKVLDVHRYRVYHWSRHPIL